MLIRFNITKNVNKFRILYSRSISGINLWNEELTPDLKFKIEEHWASKINESVNNNNHAEKYYVLPMFPYPSGNLHMGHVRVYTISDSVSRFQRMNGKNVIHPIGWDAFGLPAENAARERHVAPEEWTKCNIDYMETQLKRLGCSFDWTRELATCDPDYYKWTQDLFLKLYHAGLAYQKKALVNWDPVDKTVLADEQVDENGKAWRSGVKVEKLYLKQWFIRTTQFAKGLYDGLNDTILEDWRDIIKLQKHWIGECDGVRFDFRISSQDNYSIDFISTWTDKPEHIEHVKYLLIKADNAIADTEGQYLDDGVRKLVLTAENPVTNESVPIFVMKDLDNGLDHYLGIPGICENDQIFAQKYNVTFKQLEEHLDPAEITRKVAEVCKKARSLNRGGYWTSSKLKDWLISRQRYWGAPIPIIHCKSCGVQAVPANQLPVLLPKIDTFSSQGMSVKEHVDWINTECPRCKGPARRETDTLDTFVDSSWYYLRYLDPKNAKEMYDTNKANRLMPVDLYIGGKEHATLHLYYARFVSHFLHTLGLVPTREPFKRLLVQGMVMGRSYKIKSSGKYVKESEVEIQDQKKNMAIEKSTGSPVVMSWQKMSKSKYNGVDPSDMFEKYSVDTTRLLIMADVAPTSHRNWNSNTFPGIINWQRRLWLTIQDFLKHRRDIPEPIPDDKFKDEDFYMFDSRNYYVKGATFNYCASQQMSVALSKMQGLTNSLRKVSPFTIATSPQYERALAAQIILLAPMAPHFASELWTGFTLADNRVNVDVSEIAWNKPVLEQRWPDIDYDYALELVCQVNGRENAAIKFPRRDIEQLKKEDALRIALENERIQEVLNTRSIVDVQYDIHCGYANILNILTNQRPPKNQQQPVAFSS